MAQIRAQFKAGPGVSVSDTQFNRHCWYGTAQHSSYMCASVNQMSSQLSLLWTREHWDWTMDKWNRVSLSGESWFLIHHVDGRVSVHRLPDEQLLLFCVAGHKQAGGGCSMLWETFLSTALGPLVVVEQSMKAPYYLNVIANKLYLYMECVPNWKWNLPAR